MESSIKSRDKVAPLLSSLAEFTEQREQEALSASLGQAIRNLTDAKSVTWFRLLTSAAEPILQPCAIWQKGASTPANKDLPPAVALSSMPDFEKSLLSRQITRSESRTDNTVDLVLPLSGDRKTVEAFYLVKGIQTSEMTDHVLPLLLDIYHNFLDLLRDNQHDLLTGLLNRKTFDNRIGSVLAKLPHARHRKTDQLPERYCLAILDIDHFKRINDNFGHLYGDEVLLTLSNMMKESFREGDALFRFGGEEFVILLKNIDTEQAHLIVDRFRISVESKVFPQIGRVTVSGGLTAIQPDELPPQIIDRADRALYFAKSNGRNQVCIYETLIGQGRLTAPEVKPGSIELF
jgi:diguanylate cyclase (GGDEF)-like protein